MRKERALLLDEVQDSLGYRFRNVDLLDRALTHSSYSHEQSQSLEEQGRSGGADIGHYERLEFLGDAVIDLAVSHLLMERFESAAEGELSKLRARLVNFDQLSDIAGDLGLDKGLRLGRGESDSGGRDKPSILAAVYEACIGAIYFDAGFGEAFEVVEDHFGGLIENFKSPSVLWDYKTQLQEEIQARYKCTPSYRVVSEAGPDHAKTFKVELYIGDRACGSGVGRSKKEAEQNAARQAFQDLMSEQPLVSG